MLKATFAAEPDSVRGARDFVRESLPMGAGIDCDLVVLLVSELATNALIHVKGAFDVWVEVSPCVRVGVDDLSFVLPAVCRADALATGGRGLEIVEALADRWGAESTATGKRIWFEIYS